MNQVEIKRRQVEMCSHVLEMVTLLVLGHILGDNGIVYFAFAVETFLLFRTLTGGELRETLGRLLRVKNARGQYRNAAMLKRNALLIGGLVGILGGVAMFCCAEALGERFFEIPYCVVMIQILSPVVVLRTLSAIILSYFQGDGAEFPTVISCLLRQILIFGFSLLFAGLLEAYGQKVSALLKLDNFTAMYGGMGVALAILAAEALVLLFLFLVYRGSGKLERRGNGEGARITDTFGGQVGALYSGLFPMILIALLEQLSVWVGLIFYRRSVTVEEGLNDYGLFFGRYVPLMGILLLPACALLLESCYKVAGYVRKDEQRFARANLSGGVHIGVIHGMFFAVFVAMLAPQLAGIWGESGKKLVTQMLRFGSFVILFSILGFYLLKILLLLGGKFQVLGLLALTDLVFVVTMMVFLKSGRMGVMALIYAGVISGAVCVAAAGALLFYQTRINIDWLQCAVIPAGAACVVGLIMMFVAKLATPHLGNLVTALLCLVLGLICYWGILILLRNFREQELGYTPGGRLIRVLGQLFRFY
ncbi:MAG: hypothetical protein NC092_10305 [Butyrivibrio sp.]|nr:hypothetical protein [Muribaculum sp.]MCM1553070.1 hypothetical protein [Butyrivibrio sp.]